MEDSKFETDYFSMGNNSAIRVHGPYFLHAYEQLIPFVYSISEDFYNSRKDQSKGEINDECRIQARASQM